MKEEYFYPLYKEFDRKFFDRLKKMVKTRKCDFKGDDKDKEWFLKNMIYYQLVVKDYRKILQLLYERLGERLDLKEFNKRVKGEEFVIDESWADFLVEREMIKMARELWQAKIEIIGDQEEFDEFALRYLVSIWLADWQGPVYAILKASGNGRWEIKELNKILEKWDFTKLF